MQGMVAMAAGLSGGMSGSILGTVKRCLDLADSFLPGLERHESCKHLQPP